jgi:hypothetical protein
MPIRRRSQTDAPGRCLTRITLKTRRPPARTAPGAFSSFEVACSAGPRKRIGLPRLSTSLRYLQQAHWQASPQLHEPVSQHLQQAQLSAHEQAAAAEGRELGSRNEISITAVNMERNSKLESTCETKNSTSRSRARNHSRREQ